MSSIVRAKSVSNILLCYLLIWFSLDNATNYFSVCVTRFNDRISQFFGALSHIRNTILLCGVLLSYRPLSSSPLYNEILTVLIPLITSSPLSQATGMQLLGSLLLNTKQTKLLSPVSVSLKFITALYLQTLTESCSKASLFFKLLLFDDSAHTE